MAIRHFDSKEEFLLTGALYSGYSWGKQDRSIIIKTVRIVYYM